MTGDLTNGGLPRPAAPVWRGYLEEWDRSLRAANRPMSTRYNYELAVHQLAEFLAGDDLPRFLSASGADPGLLADSDAAEDPTDVQRKHVEWFLAWMIDTRSASTALNKYKGLQQFFRYLLDEEEIARNPMQRMSQPSTPQKLIPIVADDELAALLATCAGKTFLERRDTALIRLLMDTGARLSEITLLNVDDLDLKRDLVLVHGKGDKQRAIPFGEKTGQALTRYLRARAKHKGFESPALFLPDHRRGSCRSCGEPRPIAAQVVSACRAAVPGWSGWGAFRRHRRRGDVQPSFQAGYPGGGDAGCAAPPGRRGSPIPGVGLWTNAT
jgi:integrase/recombinase XerC